MKKLYNRLLWLGKGYARALIAFFLVCAISCVISIVHWIAPSFFGSLFGPPYVFFTINIAINIVTLIFALILFPLMLARKEILRKEQAKKPSEPPEE